MKKLIIIACTVLGLVLLSLFQLALTSIETLSSDPNYCRIASSKQASMILGTSRANTGLNTNIIDSVLKESNIELPLYNYAFNLAASPYGPTYYRSIKNKVSEKSYPGRRVFIVTISPWSVAQRKDSFGDSTTFKESKLFLAKLENVSSHPNFEYLLECHNDPFYQLFLTDKPTKNGFSDQGSLPIRNDIYDSVAIRKHTTAKMATYRENYSVRNEFSKIRYQYFEKIITHLQKFGEVYILRLPVSKPMHTLENKFQPDFSEKVQQTSKKLNVPYIDWFDMSGQFLSIDGNHLYGKGTVQVSIMLGKLLLNSGLTEDEKL